MGLFLLFTCLAVLALSGTILFLIKMGVIVQKATEQPHLDHGNYNLEQGREITNSDSTTLKR